MKRKICVVTGSRAEYGLLKHLMKMIDEHASFDLQVIATGSHLNEQFGATQEEILSDGFKIHAKIPILNEQIEENSTASIMSRALLGCTAVFETLKPDLVLLLGDRSEIMSSAIAAQLKRIPIAHLHGGESTEAMLDEAFRHSITKMSHIHFVATEEYRKRVIQLGEHPKSVHLVGGLGVDALTKTPLLAKSDVEQQLKVKFESKSLLITFHPVTLESSTAAHQISEVLRALGKLEDTTLIFTYPNFDEGGGAILEKIVEFTKVHSNSFAFQSLGSQMYFSLLQIVDGVVGNSSSGLTEAPSLKKATINIGERQLGRMKAQSIIDCNPTSESVLNGIQRIYTQEFQNILATTINPYGDGGAAQRVLDVLKDLDFTDLIKKTFYDF